MIAAEAVMIEAAITVGGEGGTPATTAASASTLLTAAEVGALTRLATVVSATEVAAAVAWKKCRDCSNSTTISSSISSYFFRECSQ